GDALHRPANLCRVAVVGSQDVEPALLEAAILHERRSDLARADDDDAPPPSQAEYFAQTAGQFRHGVAQSALPERAEEREVLAHLARRRPAPTRELITGNGLEPPTLKVLEEPEVRRQSSDGGIGDALHFDGAFVNSFTS